MPLPGMPNAVAAMSKQGSAKRPRAFGRTSNVWQYVEAVQERTTPASKYRKPSAVFAEEDEHDELDSLSGDALYPVTSGDSRKASAASGRLEPMVGGAVRTSIVGNTDHRSSTQGLRNNKSLPELVPPTVGVPTNSPGKTGGGRKPGAFNGNDIIKRIQALGTSASAPYLAPTVALASISSPLPAQGPPSVAPGPSNLAAAGITQPTTAANASASGSAAALAAAPLSEAERLRNDFNSQRGKLYYGCSVALELFNGDLMMVNSPDGAVGIQALEKMHLKSANNPSGKQRAVFTLIDLADVRSASSIRYGDAVWLQLSVGPGEVSWEQGGVLGAKVREAPQLKALALADDESIRNDAQAPLVVGHPVPVRAYLPKNRDDVDAQVDEIQSRVRNKSSKMLGKWIVRSALQRKRKSNDNFVYNNDEIYLEQDWFYLGADSDAGIAVLRQLPPASALKEAKLGEYVVERRAAWRIRLLDSSNGSAGLSLAQQQMERLLLRAKTQLKQSRKMRAGQTKQYNKGLQGGSAFVTQLRSQLITTTRECDSQYMAQQERRLSQLPQHLSTKADTLLSEDTASQLEFGSVIDETERPSGSRPASATASSPSRSPSASSHRGGDATTRGGDADLSSTGNAEGVCSLCQSSSIGYNLCCQIHHVMNTLHAEIEQASAALAAAKVNAQAQRNGHSSAPATPTVAAAAELTANEKPASTNQRKKTSATRSSATPSSPTATSGSTGPNQRLFDLFASQDKQLQDVIKYKENAAKAVLLAEAQARVGLSSVATQFRDRFKHVDQLAQQHAEDVDPGSLNSQPEEHGIGGHFLKLHAEIKREETVLRDAYNRENRANRALKHLQKLQDAADNDGDDELLLSTMDTTTVCPLELPGAGFDVYGKPTNTSRVRGPERIFPSEDEFDKLPPVDTKQAQALYMQNKNAVVEMLEGYVDLVATHILPNLASAMEGRNRGALVEFLDFAARASEFVCARRVQVRVAQLLHEIAVCDIDDFGSFGSWYEELMHEFESTAAFIRFYRDKALNQQKSKKKRK